ncbi:MAG: hypothetical protein RL684_270 [Pseudomonadota bacterium]|jgi:hypothetical protein
MAQPDLDYFRKRNLMIKPQPTPGVAPVFNGATDGFRFFDGSSSTEFDKVERNADKAFFGNDEFGVANKRGKLEGEFALYPPTTPGGAATSDAHAGVVLLPAGMAVVKDLVGKTTRYNPISAAIPMIASRFNHTGMLLEVLDGRVAISSLGIEIGQRFKGKASILGDYTEVVEEVPPNVILPTKKPVIASKRNTTCILSTLGAGGTKSTAGVPLVDLHLWAKSLSIDFGNDLGHSEYTEHGVNRIKDRKPTFNLKIAKTDITNDFNPWFVRDSMTLITVAFALYEQDAVAGEHSGLYSLLAIRGQIENITNTDIDGDMGWEITGNCVPSSTGGDEFYIEFGDKAGP